jgi:hypothetical protein
MAVEVKIKGVKDTFDELDEEIIVLINQAQRSGALAATSELVQVTPVDTGRARSSWLLSKNAQLVNKISTDTNVSVSVLGPIPKNKIETLYITNGTPYIQQLNAGSSRQAPARFIERTISKYFEVSGNFVRRR